MKMTRADFARWILLAVVCWTVVSALAGSAIGVMIGCTYVGIAIAATMDSEIKKVLRRKYGEKDC